MNRLDMRLEHGRFTTRTARIAFIMVLMKILPLATGLDGAFPARLFVMRRPGGCRLVASVERRAFLGRFEMRTGSNTGGS